MTGAVGSGCVVVVMVVVLVVVVRTSVMDPSLLVKTGEKTSLATDTPPAPPPRAMAWLEGETPTDLGERQVGGEEEER